MIEENALGAAVLSHVRLGAGKPLLLLHGLGGSWRSWTPILDALATERDVIAVDLPGFGQTPPLAGPPTIAALADAVTAFLAEQHLLGVDTVGSSMGACLVLELCRRGVIGNAIALDPGGFWEGWQRRFFALSVAASYRLVRALQPVMPFLTGNAFTRTLLLTQFSARPWDLAPELALSEMRSFANSVGFLPLLDQLVNGPPQEGAPDLPSQKIVIVWGRQDYVCFPNQAVRAQRLFPHARCVWFDSCGHFPHWDQPLRTAHLILAQTE